MFGLSLSVRLAEEFDAVFFDSVKSLGVSEHWLEQGPLVYRRCVKLPALELRGYYADQEGTNSDIEWFEHESDLASAYLLGFTLDKGPTHLIMECSRTVEIPVELDAVWDRKVHPLLEQMQWGFWSPGVHVISLD